MWLVQGRDQATWAPWPAHWKNLGCPFESSHPGPSVHPVCTDDCPRKLCSKVGVLIGKDEDLQIRRKHGLGHSPKTPGNIVRKPLLYPCLNFSEPFQNMHWCGCFAGDTQAWGISCMAGSLGTSLCPGSHCALVPGCKGQSCPDADT